MIEQALQVFNLPYEVTEIQENDNYILYRLKALNGSATLTRLRTRLDDIKGYIDKDVSIVQDHGICLRVEKESQKTFLYTQYNGYLDDSMELPYMVGLTANECIVEDLTKSPHLLVAGTTGSGKSNYLHTLITSLICCDNAPYMYLIDCKKVEFSVYGKHAQVVSEVSEVVNLLEYIVSEMDDRYARMQQAGVNNFKDFKKLYPSERYHVIVVDELADLISTKEARKTIIPMLLRIAQIGRAGGFHLVLATQRPDHSVINGTLKGNIPTRICFNCASRIDSQIVLDRAGAEHLTGNGDGLYLKNGSRDLTRFQATYIPMDYIKSIMDK